MYYFYNPTSLTESQTTKITIIVAEQSLQVDVIQNLGSDDIHDGEDVYVLYPTLASILSQCIFDSNVRESNLAAWLEMQNKLVELKNCHSEKLVFVGIDLYKSNDRTSVFNDFSVQIECANQTQVIEQTLALGYVNQNKMIKQSVGRLQAISSEVESEGFNLSYVELIDFVEKSMKVEEAFGDYNVIQKSLTDYEAIKTTHHTSVQTLKETLDKLNFTEGELDTLGQKHEDAVSQLLLMQEKVVELYHENESLKDTFEERLEKSLSQLNSENNVQLELIEKLKQESVHQQSKLESTVQTLQKLQESYEKQLLLQVSFEKRLAIEIEEKNASCSKLNSTIEILKREKNEHKSKSKKLQNEIVESGEEKKLIITELLDSTKEVEILNQRIKQFKDESQQDKKNSITRQKLIEREKVRLESRLESISHRYSALRYEIFCKNRELEIIHSSPLWKGSKLFRSLKSILSRNKISESVKADIELIAKSELFDFDWYIETYADVKEAGVDPAQHYLTCGGEEGRMPGPNFDGSWYLERYPDIDEAGINPLLHYIKCGKREGRVSSPKLISDKR